MNLLDFKLKPITTISTPFPEKFGVPRQPLLVPEAIGKMVFPKDDFSSEAFRGIDGFSHLWLIFQFHQIGEEKLNALIRPPRFAGKKKLGVYATRSPHRPNRIGLSVVRFESFEIKESTVELTVSGVDLVDGTPILDIKPYIPYCDSILGATAQAFTRPPESLPVAWRCERPTEAPLIEKVVALDPRPGHDRDGTEEFGVSVGGFNVRFREEGGQLVILRADALESSRSR